MRLTVSIEGHLIPRTNPGAALGTGRDKKQAGQPGVAQPADAAAEEGQVSSKPVEWPMVPPGSKRQRSRLHQTPGSAPPGATPEDLSPHLVRLSACA